MPERAAEDNRELASVCGAVEAAPDDPFRRFAGLRLLPVPVLELFDRPNSASTLSNCVACMLSWTMSFVGAFFKADITAGDDITGELSFERVWSKFATPGLIEETEPIRCTS